MTSETNFLAQIAADRADRQSRLVFADFLDEIAERPRDAALQRVLAQPDDDAMRLAYATACEAVGEKRRAEFVRIQCDRANPLECTESTLSGMAGGRRAGCPRCIRLLREAELLADPALLLDLVPAAIPPMIQPHVPVRGFVDAFDCAPADWEKHGDAVCDVTPVKRVVLSAVPVLKVVRTETRMPRFVLYDVAGKQTAVDEMQFVEWRKPGELQPTTAVIAKALYEVRWPGVTFEFPAPTSFEAFRDQQNADILAAIQDAYAMGMPVSGSYASAAMGIPEPMPEVEESAAYRQARHQTIADMWIRTQNRFHPRDDVRRIVRRDRVDDIGGTYRFVHECREEREEMYRLLVKGGNPAVREFNLLICTREEIAWDDQDRHRRHTARFYAGHCPHCRTVFVTEPVVTTEGERQTLMNRPDPTRNVRFQLAVAEARADEANRQMLSGLVGEFVKVNFPDQPIPKVEFNMGWEDRGAVE